MHKKELGELELANAQMGWRVRFFLAASNKKGVVQFKRDVHFGSKHGVWGARIVRNEKQLSDPVIYVPAIDFAEWFEENVLKREIPNGPGEPVALQKLIWNLTTIMCGLLCCSEGLSAKWMQFTANTQMNYAMLSCSKGLSKLFHCVLSK